MRCSNRHTSDFPLETNGTFFNKLACQLQVNTSSAANIPSDGKRHCEKRLETKHTSLTSSFVAKSNQSAKFLLG